MSNEGPDFLGIGVARSGTTTAYKVLKRHPDIFMPETKELHFFTSSNQANTESPDNITTIEEEYRNRFSPKGSRIGGEISPSYFYFPGTAEKIHAFNPDIKLFCILRNPVDRALSDFHYSGLNKDMSSIDFFMQGIRELQDNSVTRTPFSPSTIIFKGLYSYHITIYANQFPDNQLLFLPFDLLKNDAEQFFQHLFSFLGVQENIEDVIASENAASYPEKTDDSQARELLEKVYHKELMFFEEFKNNWRETYHLARNF